MCFFSLSFSFRLFSQYTVHVEVLMHRAHGGLLSCRSFSMRYNIIHFLQIK